MSKRIYVFFSALAAIVFVVLCFFILKSEYIYASDGVYTWEFFIWINSGYAFVKNTELVGGLGYVFSLITGSAFILLDKFDLGLNKINFLSSLIFSSSLVIIWTFIRKFTNYKIPLIVLVLLVSHACACQITGNWAGNYNLNLWSLLSLQMILSAMIFDRGETLKEIKNKDIYILSIIQALFLWVAFNYKLNFFAVSVLIASISAMFFPVKKTIRYVLSAVVFFLLLNILTALLSGYDYFAYLKNLQGFFVERWKQRTETQASLSLKLHLFGGLSFVALLGVIVFTKVMSVKPKTEGRKNFSLVRSIFGNFLEFFSTLNFKTVAQYLLFACVVSLGVHILIVSNALNGRRFYAFPLAIIFFVFLHHRYKKVLLFAFCFVFLFWMDVDFAKLFIKPSADNYEEIVLRNVNPKYEVKFFVRTKEFNERIKTVQRKYNLDMKASFDSMTDYFDDIVDFYYKFKLNDQYRLTMPAIVNVAPFVIDGKYPIPALLWQDETGGMFLIQKEPEVYDIVIISKGNNSTRLENIVMRNYVLSHPKQFEKIYETSLLIFYANKNGLGVKKT
jgi:hypothetical protein